MTLTVILLMTLAMLYQNASYAGLELDRMKTENFSFRYLENRMMRLLPKIAKAGKPDSLFFSIEHDGLTAENSQSLMFSFDNGDLLDKIFSNLTIGRLFLDKNQNLILAYWPIPIRLEHAEGPIPIKKEILMNNVESFHIDFYVANEEEYPTEEKGYAPNREALEAPKQALKPGWQHVWMQEYQELPAMVRLTITRTRNPRPLVFTIPLPNSKAKILYQGAL